MVCLIMMNTELGLKVAYCLLEARVAPWTPWKLFAKGTCTNLALKNSLDESKIIFSSKDFRIEILTLFFFLRKAYSCKQTMNVPPQHRFNWKHLLLMGHGISLLHHINFISLDQVIKANCLLKTANELLTLLYFLRLSHPAVAFI